MSEELEVAVAAPADVEVPAGQTTEPAAEETIPPAEVPKPELNEDGTLPKGVQKRIDRAVRRQYEAEARAKVLEERMAQLEQRAAPAPQRSATPEEPTLDKFSNFDEYVSAKAEYIASKRVQDALQERDQRMRAESLQAEQSRSAAEWQRKLANATAELPDFEDVIGSSDVPMTPAMRDAITSSDVGPKLAYWLAQNHDEAVKIAKMSPVSQIRALGRIEERLEKVVPAAPAVSNAPAPIKPVGSRASASKDPDKMTTEEWLTWRNEQIKAKR